MAKAVDMKGLKNFIAEIRECKNVEEENRRVEKELAKIRAKFGSDRQMTGYDQKKYVWKLLYIYMLGYNVEFGHKQAADLIPQPKYAHKQVGYVACSVLLNEHDEFLRLVINSIRSDVISRNEAFQCLALSFVGCVGGQEMAEALTSDIMKILSSGQFRSLVRKKAALALLRLHRKTPVDMSIIQSNTFAPQLAKVLDESDLGLLLCAVTLLQGLLQTDPTGYDVCLPRVVGILEKIISFGPQVVADSYLYYKIPVPWLQAKCLRCLQYFDPPDNTQLVSSLTNVLKSVIRASNEMASKQEAAQSNARMQRRPVNRDNALHCILFEAITLCLYWDLGEQLLNDSVTILGKFATGKEANTKYLALESMQRLAQIPEVLGLVKQHLEVIVSSLQEPDLSIRRRAMDLLFVMCDGTNADVIVRELLRYLPTCDYTLREELVLKMAIMAERFAPSVQWYIDTTLEMMQSAGDYMSDDVWCRVIQLIGNNDNMQPYAAQKCINVVQEQQVTQGLLCVSAYVLGEYGSSIQSQYSPYDQFKLLYKHYHIVNNVTQGILQTCFIKLLLQDSGNMQFKNEVSALFDNDKQRLDAELQQRAVEYDQLMQNPQQTRSQYLTKMPKWPERQSFLMKRLQQNNPDSGGQVSGGAATMGEDGSRSLNMEAQSGGIGVPAAGGSTQEGDLLGGTLTSPKAGHDVSAMPQQSNVSPVDALDDLLGGGGGGMGGGGDMMGGGAAVADPFAAQGAVDSLATPQTGISVIGDVQQWYKNLLTQSRGVLYEDTVIQIGVQCTITPPTGVVTLYIGNKQQQGAVQRLSLHVSPTPVFNINQQQTPPTIQPMQQLQVQIEVRCLSYFSHPPPLALSYQWQNQSQSVQLQLPTPPHKFFIPQPAYDKTQFFNVWRSVTGEPLKSAKMVNRSSALPRESVIQLMQSVNLGVKPGYIDPSLDNAAGVSVFKYGQEGQDQEDTVMVRIEGNPAGRQQFKVTVTSSNAMVTSSLRDLLSDLLTTMA